MNFFGWVFHWNDAIIKQSVFTGTLHYESADRQQLSLWCSSRTEQISSSNHNQKCVYLHSLPFTDPPTHCTFQHCPFFGKHLIQKAPKQVVHLHGVRLCHTTSCINNISLKKPLKNTCINNNDKHFRPSLLTSLKMRNFSQCRQNVLRLNI